MTNHAADPNCLFCKIISGAIPAEKLYDDPEFICISDIHPQAKHHYLVIPKTHVVSLAEAFPAAGSGLSALVGRLFEVATEIARRQGLLPGGFRSVINTHRDGGQSVFHLHLHILGGGPLKGTFA